MKKILEYIDFWLEIFYTKIKSYDELMNSGGIISNDFKNGDNKTNLLHKLNTDYTILFLNNPNCTECERADEYMKSSSIIERLESLDKLAILSIHPDENLSFCIRESYPKNWISVYDLEQKIVNYNEYDLRVMPIIYLLDKDKRVVLQSIRIERIEDWFSTNLKMVM